jgi:hypothetical protein
VDNLCMYWNFNPNPVFENGVIHIRKYISQTRLIRGNRGKNPFSLHCIVIWLHSMSNVPDTQCSHLDIQCSRLFVRCGRLFTQCSRLLIRETPGLPEIR